MFFVLVVLNAMGIGGYLFAIAVIEDSKCMSITIDEHFKTKKIREQIYNQFIEFIDLQATIKQLSCQTSHVPSGSISVSFCSDFSALCSISPTYIDQSF